MESCKDISKQCAFENVKNQSLYDMDEISFYKKINNQTLPTITSLNDLIRELQKVFESDTVNIEYVYYLMRSYKSNPTDWTKFAKFDRYRYTRNLIDVGNGKYNLMVLCWGEGHGAGIHDHADSHCFMKTLHGSLQEVRYSWPEEVGKELNEISRNNLSLNDVCYINDSLGLHRVENPSNVETAVSLHLYCPPYERCQVFNQYSGQRSICKVTFWSMFGEKRKREIQDEREPEDN
ncbi:cysteine dioxygenase type 1 [Agrilus planipennis]|uniref:Cysteine dioxygenase n=1 Tax=Agrilus planipennis TaxID=224129 RepID=A0A1W4WQY4_AGRPL|nr:cysteine dioxygenase type 1 [Agrilus planipennis]